MTQDSRSQQTDLQQTGLFGRVSRPSTLIDGQEHELPIGGQSVRCVDIRGAAQRLNRSVDTLRRYDSDSPDKLKFVWHGGRRYLPVAKLEAAKVALRKTGELAKMLGVSGQTVRNWKKDIPPNTDAHTTEQLLMQRAAQKRKPK